MNRKIIPRCPFDDEIFDAQCTMGATNLLSERIEPLRPLVGKLEVGKREFAEAEKIAEELKTLVGDYPPLAIARLLDIAMRMKKINASRAEISKTENDWLVPYRLFTKFNNLLTEAWRQVEIEAEHGTTIAIGKKRRQKQSEVGKQPRNPELKDIENNIIPILARMKGYKVRELWPELFAMLSERFETVKETGNCKQPKTWKLTIETTRPDPKNKGCYMEVPYSFRTFQKKIGEARK